MNTRLGALLDDKRRRVRAKDTEGWDEKAERLLSECHPSQRAFAEDPSSRVAVLCPARAGKTTAGRVRMAKRMLITSGARCLFIATSREQAELLMWPQIKRIFERLGVAYLPNETKLRITLPKNDAQLRLVGADDKKQVEKYRGLPHHEVGIDEAGSYRPSLLSNLITEIIGPRLGDFHGCLWMTGTPSRTLRGLFYDITRSGSDIGVRWEEREEESESLRWSVHAWSLQEAAQYVPEAKNAWEEGLREKKRHGWADDHPIWKREYLGIWAADDTENVFKYRPHLEDGTEWNQWDPPKDPRTKIAILPKGHEWHYVYAMDLGHSDPFALGIFAYSHTEGILRHIYEFEAKGMYVRPVAKLLIGEELKADSPMGLIGATGWPDGMVADTAHLGGWILDELKNVYGISVDAVEKSQSYKFDAIELANGDLVDGRVKILKGSQLETQLQNLQWAIDAHGMLKLDRSARNDCADYFIYARQKAYHLFMEDAPQERPEPGTPEAAELEMEEKLDELSKPDDEFSEMVADDGYFDEMWD